MENQISNLLREQGVVIGIDGDEVLVETQRSTGCSGCSSESGCGTSALAKLFSTTSKAPIRVKNNLHCEIGDSVELVLDESRLLQHSFMAYGLPLIGLFVLAISFSKIALHVFSLSPGLAELSAILGGVLGLYLGWWITRKLYKPVMPELSKVITKSL
ncbi:sigma E factor positive regulatory protein RseC [Thiomicrorhabdus immobilis]|uniref:Sigma E factor positive regulatory protein RseC n=1 Tax=Thiomicrorhabdus immobilis TaxID=2791037 RepID=A0ABN6CW51_9GAMM|nr:SoxR reducing system RseC family protein [Thiomicrorhabdus immobilis]BCN93153.1 sigma E factor positive regulatory protein RseC [Thiomicrorhabdus immobilis]